VCVCVGSVNYVFVLHAIPVIMVYKITDVILCVRVYSFAATVFGWEYS
jgi:hypothetical protein